MTRTALALLLASGALLGAPAAGAASAADASGTDTVESLHKQLAAQQAINRQLRDRLQRLERELAASRAGGDGAVLTLDADALPPPAGPEMPASAVERALVGKGMLLMPAGAYRLTPGLTWSHGGSGDSRRDAYTAAVSLDAGLAKGYAVSLAVPYSRRDYPLGRNSGPGDVSLGLSKQFNAADRRQTSWVGHLVYRADNGEDAFAAVPVGNGFKTLTAALSAARRMDPLVLYGYLAYSHEWAKTTTYFAGGTYQMGRITPADTYGLGLGVSLAATPEVSLDAGLSFDFQGRGKVAPAAGGDYRLARSSAGYVNMGAGFLLSRELFLNLMAAAGVTDDADDFVLSAELPYQF